MTSPDAPVAPTTTFGLHEVLFVAWVASIAADRVDLLGRSGGFVMRPFLLLTPLVVLSEVRRRTVARRPIVLGRAGVAFCALALALLGIVGASVFVSPDTTISGGRAVLLLADLVGALVVTMLTSDRTDLAALFDRAAVAGILLYLCFDVLELASLAGILPQTAHLGPADILLYPSTYGGIVPRLSGMVLDQNRSGFILLFYGWWVAFRPAGPPRRGYLLLIAVMMLLTLSRSGFVAALATLAVLLLERRIRWAPRRTLLALGLFTSVALASLVTSEAARRATARLLRPFALRFSLEEGSSQAHLTLIERGVDVVTGSLQHLVLGIGYGSAYTVLQDLFPGNRYGNFHSLYVTFLAECGIFGLLCLLLMFLVPLGRGGPYRALVAGAAVFNVFYQSTNDPAFWTVLSLAWCTLPAKSATRRGGRGDAATVARLSPPALRTSRG